MQLQPKKRIFMISHYCKKTLLVVNVYYTNNLSMNKDTKLEKGQILLISRLLSSKSLKILSSPVKDRRLKETAVFL